ncbi:DUF1254 domain-containing protein [Synechococcus sp. Tobar12-5m-g]|uniref:DUF1254 domain-containing protein n=1 Tax=unclassified Synechococcus TaxID=2626047 RepID=UPI0020CD7A78|nr:MULTISPECIES: DUF1254 domain-containing protein [unclassified Synechococcus]MCP9773856.1 DUF1254 domain-containing protein [Synechococcus sp. Tobar12-5m-g]MCP9874856.1 DUF1254 domain-containing protein [Synechococcus sp. Cruz CV-v-12]
MNQTPAETLDTPIGRLSFTPDFINGYPSGESVELLFDQIDFQRACQAYLWSIPIVSFAEWQKGHEVTFKARAGDVVVYDNYLAKLGILTANATTPYIISFFNLEETGPMVVRMPAGAVAGFADDMWQRPLIDMGQTGPDKGQGGVYVISGPGQNAEAPKGGYLAESPTSNVFWGFRALDKDPAKAKALLQMLEIYPLSKSDNPPKKSIVDISGIRWSQTPPRGIDYWKSLHAIIQREPVHERDRWFMAMLMPLGIEKGKPFEPDERQSRLLTDGALVGEAMAKANDFEKRLKEAQYAEGTHWHFALVIDPSQRADFYDQLDGRAAWFYEAVTTSSGMVTRTPGVGQVYLGTYKDKDGDWLDGTKSYRLRVPADAPVEQFWSMTVYDVGARCLIDNPSQQADRSSRMDLKVNDDGSIDLYVGPKAPAGKEGNWVETVPGRGWFSYFRLYGPKQEHFDGSWVLPDFEKTEV